MKTYDSSKFSHLLDSIKHSKTNKFCLTNLSRCINVQDKVLLYEPHIFEEYYHILIGYCKEYILPENEYYKPEFTALRVYKTCDLWWLVLWLNKISTLFDYNCKTINVLEYAKLNLLYEILLKHERKLKYYRTNPIKIPDLTLKKIIV